MPKADRTLFQKNEGTSQQMLVHARNVSDHTIIKTIKIKNVNSCEMFFDTISEIFNFMSTNLYTGFDNSNINYTILIFKQ